MKKGIKQGGKMNYENTGTKSKSMDPLLEQQLSFTIWILFWSSQADRARQSNDNETMSAVLKAISESMLRTLEKFKEKG